MTDEFILGVITGGFSIFAFVLLVTFIIVLIERRDAKREAKEWKEAFARARKAKEQDDYS